MQLDLEDAETRTLLNLLTEAIAVVHPPTDDRLPGFPRAVRVRSKTFFAAGLRRRWKEPDGGTIYEWDYRHGTVEVYDARGHHRGEFDPLTGERIGPPDPRRTGEP